MLIPIGVDVPFDRRPYLNWLMLVVLVVFFGFQFAAIRGNPDYAFEGFRLDGFEPGGFFAHMWLHGGPIDLIVNIYFLWVFGNAVCAKIGNLLYLPVFIILGFVAAITFNIVSDEVALGASGAINGIAGMFLVFFPVNDVNMMLATRLYYSYRSWEFTLPSIVMVVLWLVFDSFVVSMGIGMVSYAAHYVSFGAGVLIAILLLKFKIVKTESYERSLLQVFSGENDKQAEEDRLWELRHNNSDLHQELYQAENDYDQQENLQPGYEITEKPARFAYQHEDYEDDAIAIAPVDDGYIRFACQCGKKLKMHGKYAGKTGKCPKCTSRIRIPG